MKKTITRLCLVTILMNILTFPVLALETEVNRLPTLEKVKLTLSSETESVSKTARLDNGMYLVYTLKCTSEQQSTGLRTTIRRTLTSECIVRGADGTELGTLTAKGVFDTNGATSDPQDAYGYGQVKRYTIQNTANTLSTEQFSAWVRVTLKGVPAGPVQEFTYRCVITCDANGNYRASWN